MGHRVQSDERETERRNLAWVGQSDGMPTEQDHREWMAEEIPFQADPRPWERADLIVASALDRARIAIRTGSSMSSSFADALDAGAAT